MSIRVAGNYWNKGSQVLRGSIDSSSAVSERGGQHPVNQLSIGVALVLVIFFFSSAFVFMLAFQNDSQVMRASFAALGFEGLCIGLCIFIKASWSGLYLFEPFSMVTFVYSLTLFFAPLIEFALGNTTRFGIDVSGNAFIGTAVAAGGYAFFAFGYELYHPGSHKRRSNEPVLDSGKVEERERVIAKIAFVIWFLAYCMCLYNYAARGYSMLYVVTAGLSETGGADINEDSLGFLAYAKYTLVGCWMCVLVYGRSGVLKVILFLMSFAMLFFGGSRSSLLLLLIAPVAYYYISRNSTPKIRSLVLVALVLVLAFSVIQVVRNGIKLGEGFDLSGYTLEGLFAPYLNEVETYKVYYALFDVFPDKMQHLYGEQMFGQTLTMMIPRAIWSDKPEAIVHTIVYLALGMEALLRGNAYPLIGELFVEFGIPGCLVGMCLVGAICKRLCLLANRGGDNRMPTIVYCLVFAALFQFLIRGYLPSNAMMLLFLVTPVLVVNALARISERRDHGTVQRINIEGAS